LCWARSIWQSSVSAGNIRAKYGSGWSTNLWIMSLLGKSWPTIQPFSSPKIGNYITILDYIPFLVHWSLKFELPQGTIPLQCALHFVTG
jgi:hypothetical protein